MERRAFRLNGFFVLLLTALVAAGLAALFRAAAGAQQGPLAGGLTVVGVLLLIAFASGLTVVNPNEAKVVQFFGRYVGTVRDAGFYWTVPLSTKREVSLRVRNFESARLKVSDADGNPV